MTDLVVVFICCSWIGLVAASLGDIQYIPTITGRCIMLVVHVVAALPAFYYFPY